MFQTQAAVTDKRTKNRTDLGVAADATGVYEVPHRNHDGVAMRVYRLRCIRDGMCRDFVDDGEDSGGGPLNGRQALLAACRKVTPEGLPIFFADKRIPGNISVPVADDAVRAFMTAAIEARGVVRRTSDDAVAAQQAIEVRKSKVIQKAVNAAVEVTK